MGRFQWNSALWCKFKVVSPHKTIKEAHKSLLVFCLYFVASWNSQRFSNKEIQLSDRSHRVAWSSHGEASASSRESKCQAHSKQVLAVELAQGVPLRLHSGWKRFPRVTVQLQDSRNSAANKRCDRSGNGMGFWEISNMQ